MSFASHIATAIDSAPSALVGTTLPAIVRQNTMANVWLVKLIFLHGAAASGKLTTARALEGLVGYPVFHNHLVVDALTTVFPFGSEPFVRLREQFWLQVFTDAANTDRSLTFTFAPEATVQSGFSDRVRKVTEAVGGRTHFVRLLVGDAEQERRIGAESRRQFHKLTDVESLRRLRTYRHGVEQPPVDLEINTEASAPEDSAALIVRHFCLAAESRTHRYPSFD